MVENKLKNTKINHRFEYNMKEQKTSRKRALLVLSLLAVNLVAYIFAYSYFKSDSSNSDSLTQNSEFYSVKSAHLLDFCINMLKHLQSN